MKSRLIITVAFLCVLHGFAQVPKFSIGPKVGYNTTRFTTDMDSINNDYKGAFQFGAFARFGNTVYIQPEINYVVKGGALNKEFSVQNINQEVTLKTVTIPVLFGIRAVHLHKSNIRFMMGPAFSYVVEKELKPSQVVGYWPIRTTDDIKRTNWSIQAGAGFDLLFLTFDLRYEMGVDNIYTGNDDFNIRNNLFNFSVGIKFF